MQSVLTVLVAVTHRVLKLADPNHEGVEHRLRLVLLLFLLLLLRPLQALARRGRLLLAPPLLLLQEGFPLPLLLQLLLCPRRLKRSNNPPPCTQLTVEKGGPLALEFGIKIAPGPPDRSLQLRAY